MLNYGVPGLDDNGWMGSTIRNRFEQLTYVSKCFRIIANICLFEEFHPAIIQAGWVTLLARASKSAETALKAQVR